MEYRYYFFNRYRSDESSL